jgi:hypothetical protein
VHTTCTRCSPVPCRRRRTGTLTVLLPPSVCDSRHLCSSAFVLMVQVCTVMYDSIRYMKLKKSRERLQMRDNTNAPPKRPRFVFCTNLVIQTNSCSIHTHCWHWTADAVWMDAAHGRRCAGETMGKFNANTVIVASTNLKGCARIVDSLWSRLPVDFRRRGRAS